MSSGKLMDDLVFTSSGQNNFEYTPEIFVIQGIGANKLHSNNMIRTSNAANGSHIGYSMVTKKKVNVSGSNTGKTVSRFINQPNEYLTRNIGFARTINSVSNYDLAVYTAAFYSAIYNENWSALFSGTTFPVYYGDSYIIGGVVYDHSYKNGKLIDNKTYDIYGNIVHETINKYKSQFVSMPFNYYPKTPFYNYGVSNVFHPFETIYANQLNKNILFVPDEKIIKNYLNGEEISSLTKFFYESTSHLMPTKVSVTTNTSENKIINRTYYPQDILSEPFISNLIENNRTTIPILKETSKLVLGNEQKLSSQKNTYKIFDNDFIHIDKVLFSKGSNDLEEQVVYHNYDEKGNPREISKPDGSHIVFIWGYNSQHLIAKIENAKFSEIPTSLYASIRNKSNLDYSTADENILRTELNKLRSTSHAPNLLNAMISTYTYDPLIGVTSMTDPRGNVIYYEYDSFNRLKHIKDKDGKILSKNDYNYKN